MFRLNTSALVGCLGVSVFIAGCGRTVIKPETSTADESSAAGSKSAALADFEIAEGIAQGRLTVFPVLSKAPRTDDRFITLEEGLLAGTVEVFEVGANPARQARQTVLEAGDDDVLQQTAGRPARGPAPERDAADQTDAAAPAAIAGDETGDEADDPFEQVDLADGDMGNDVNRLMVRNKSNKPLYLMPGEVIVGGSQDRAIAEEMVIAATGTPVPVDVFCVEHGRWGDRPQFLAADIIEQVTDNDVDGQKLAAEANSGKFVVSAGYLAKSSRLATQTGEGQGKVWDEVARQNLASRVESETGAFTANYVDKDVQGQLQPYLAALVEPVARQERIVGVIVAIDGKVESVDVFESTPLFQKLWPRLLKSYALDALSSATEESDRPAAPTCTVAQARSFLETVLAGEVEATKEHDGGLLVTRRNTSQVMSFSLGGGMGGGGMGGGFGGQPIHAAGFAK